MPAFGLAGDGGIGAEDGEEDAKLDEETLIVGGARRTEWGQWMKSYSKALAACSRLYAKEVAVGSGQRISSLAIAARAAAAGRVMSQERRISVTFFHGTWGVFFNPAPMMAPVETWVVETGRPFQEARQTRAAV